MTGGSGRLLRVRIPVDLTRWLGLFAEAEDRSEAWVVRRALRAWLSEHAGEWEDA